MPSLFTPTLKKPLPSAIGVPMRDDEEPCVPSIRFEISKGTALEEFNEITSRTKLCFDFDVVGKRHRFF
jgi:hypothetical protein